MEHGIEYAVLIDLFIKLVESQAGTKIERGSGWQSDAQTLALKLSRHLVSMKTISAGVTIENKNAVISFVDHASVHVLTRAALETYLVFFYIYGGSDPQIAAFRHKTWRLGGIADRQQLSATTQESHDVLAREKVQFDELKAELEAAPELARYSEKQRRKLLQGDWKIGISWIDLGVSAGFHKKYFTDVYSHLCGYSHSSYVSAMQVGQAHSIQDQVMLTETMLDIGIVIMAHFVFAYAEVFPSASAVLDGDAEAKAVAVRWRFGPEDMASTYDRSPATPQSL